jgi:hypothetical protein
MAFAIAAGALLISGCPQRAEERSASPGGRIDARVLTIQTVTSPEERQAAREVLVAGNHVRLTDEQDRWRLFDLEQPSVSIIDEIAQTYQVHTLAELLERKRELARGEVPPNFPAVNVVSTGRTMEIGGITAQEHLVTMGSFRRELWLSSEPLIDSDFFRLLIATEPIGGNYPAAMARAHLRLVELEGFPVLDRIVTTYGQKSLSIERRLSSIEQRQVDRSLLTLPADFQNVTPPDEVRAPVAGPRSAS